MKKISLLIAVFLLLNMLGLANEYNLNDEKNIIIETNPYIVVKEENLELFKKLKEKSSQSDNFSTNSLAGKYWVVLYESGRVKEIEGISIVEEGGDGYLEPLKLNDESRIPALKKIYNELKRNINFYRTEDGYKEHEALISDLYEINTICYLENKIMTEKEKKEFKEINEKIKEIQKEILNK